MNSESVKNVQSTVTRTELGLVLLNSGKIEEHEKVIMMIKVDKRFFTTKHVVVRHRESINENDLYGVVFADSVNMCGCRWCWTIRKIILTNQGMGVEKLV